jgi:hypothetical protein
MKRLLPLATAFIVFVLAGPGATYAQVKKTFQRTNMNGQTVQQPYLTYEEFRSVMVRAPNGHVPLHKLLTVSTLEEASRLLGEPRLTERNGGPESFTAWLRYEGDTNVEYVGSEDDSLKLTSIELHSSSWGFKIRDKELSPGMSTNRFDAAVRQSAVPKSRSKSEDMSGTGAIYIAKSNTKKKREVDPLQNGLTQFNFNVDETGVVEVVRLSRVPNQSR